MKINSNFDGGSIEVLNIDTKENHATLNLAQENRTNDKQWFYFHCQVKQGVRHFIKIANANEASFANAWNDYQVVASYDKQSWFRVSTSYNGKELVFEHTPEESDIYYAYFTPFSYKQHKAFIDMAAQSPNCSNSSLGLTSDGYNIDLLTFGVMQNHKKKVWIIARQHPGETMAEWFIKGLVTRLLSNDRLSKALLKSSVFYIIPNMNIDGSILGNHRTNSQGLNLNREWKNATKTYCPEVFYTKQAMKEYGVDLFIDVHGDEEIPHNFIIGGNTNSHLMSQTKNFKAQLVALNSDFQTAVVYTTFNKLNNNCCSSNCGKKDLTKANYYVEEVHECLSLVLEMPFKVNQSKLETNTKNPQIQCMTLGNSVLETIGLKFISHS
jgi:murein tripeptide amidase MpaA